VIRFSQVGLRYGTDPEVLSDISFHLPAGSFHFLTGPSGAGKSSLLSLMYLAQSPTSGSITLFGQMLGTLRRNQLPPLRRRIGVVFQDFRLIDHLTAVENVALPLRVAGASDSEIRDHSRELLTWVGLGDRVDALPKVLSGGEKQRVAIARAVISRPNLLLADEPTGNLDSEVGLRLIHLLTELNKIGTTVVVATHNRDLIRSIDKPVIRLENGKMVQHNPPTDANSGPAHDIHEQANRW